VVEQVLRAPAVSGQLGEGEPAYNGDPVRVRHRRPRQQTSAFLVRSTRQGLRAELQQIEGEEPDRDVIDGSSRRGELRWVW
jgi:hypothetical protein